MIVGYLSRNKYKIAWIVLAVSVMLSIFVRFPTAFYDEQIHYIRAKGVANGQLLSKEKVDGSGALGHDIDLHGVEYINHYYKGDRSKPVSLGWLTDDVGKVDASSEQTFAMSTSAAPYSPVPYLPFALGSKVSQAMHFSVMGEFLTMRIFGALAALSIIFAAFGLSPVRYKWMTLVVALIPMSLSAFAAISIDGYTIATSLLFTVTIARVVDLVRRNKLENKDIAILAVSSFLLVFAKMPAFLMIAMILGVVLIFRKKIIKKHILLMLSIIGISAIVTVLWAWYAKDINTGAFWGRNVDTLEQIKFIISEPLIFTRNLIYSVINYDYTNIIYTLGYANHVKYSSLPFVIDIIVFGGLFLSAFISMKQPKPAREQKLLFWFQVLTFVMISIAIFILLYLQFTPIGTPNNIDGVQPRYFLPFIPLLILIPHRLILSRGWRIFAMVAPFIGALFYLGIIIAQVM